MYKCTKTSGGGTIDDAGDWEKIETKKTITFKIIRKPFFSLANNLSVISIHKEKHGKHTIYDWEDGTYTVYPNRSGIPFYFEPHTLNQPEKEIDTILTNPK